MGVERDAKNSYSSKEGVDIENITKWYEKEIPIKDIGSEDLVERLNQPFEKKRKKLEENSQQLPELVQEIYFTVKYVDSQSYRTSFTPISETSIGGPNPHYEGGFKSVLELIVKPEENIPVERLIFSGSSPVRGGDYIYAKIPRYTKESLFQGLEESTNYYFDRDFKPKEEAIEITLLSDEGEPLRRDKAVNYKSYMPD